MRVVSISHNCDDPWHVVPRVGQQHAGPAVHANLHAGHHVLLLRHLYRHRALPRANILLHILDRFLARNQGGRLSETRELALQPPPPLYQLQPQSNARVLLVLYRRCITFVDIVQGLFGFSELVVERYEVGDRIVVVGDEQTAEDGFGARDERLVALGGEAQRARRGAPARARQRLPCQVPVGIRTESARPLDAPAAHGGRRGLRLDGPLLSRSRLISTSLPRNIGASCERLTLPL